MQGSGNVSLHDPHGGYLGNITTDQIQRHLSVLNVNNSSAQNSCAQVLRTKFTLSDGTPFTSQPQPHLTLLPLPSPGTITYIVAYCSTVGIKDHLTLSSESWIIDTWTSCHVCGLSLFVNTETIVNTYVTFPDGTTLPVISLAQFIYLIILFLLPFFMFQSSNSTYSA